MNKVAGSTETANTEIINQVAAYVRKLFTEKLPKEYTYHRLEHTEKVVADADEIGRGMELSSEELEIVLVASWLHDTGYTEVYIGHEAMSAIIAEKFLSERNYDPIKLQRVLGCIMATQVPQLPQNLLEQVICDADLLYLGQNNFADWSERLREEWNAVIPKNYSDKEWAKLNLDFVGAHFFHTSYARNTYDAQQFDNLMDLGRIYEQT